MKKRNIIFSPRGFAVIFIAALILAACATPPTEEMNNANDAVTRAENDADAVTYAGNTLVRARDALTRMQAEADAKRYDAAKNFAAEAISLADKAIADGKTGAARAREEAANLVNSTGGSITETAAALDAARQVENIQVDFDGIDAEMDSIRGTYDEARQNLENNSYPEAVSKCQNIRSALTGINTRLSEAAQATNRKQ